MVGVISVKVKGQSIRLVELVTTVMRLKTVIDSDHVEAGPLIAFRGSPSSTE